MNRQQLTEYYVTWLERELEAQHLTYRALAAKAGMNPASVWKILNRQVEPKDMSLERLAEALNRPLPETHLIRSTPLPGKHQTPETGPSGPPGGRSRRQPRAGPGKGRGAQKGAEQRAGTPPAVAEEDTLLDVGSREVLAQRAERIGEAVQAAIMRNEWYGGRYGRAVLIDWLSHLVDDFGEHGADVRDLVAVKKALEEDRL